MKNIRPLVLPLFRQPCTEPRGMNTHDSPDTCLETSPSRKVNSPETTWITSSLLRWMWSGVSPPGGTTSSNTAISPPVWSLSNLKAAGRPVSMSQTEPSSGPTTYPTGTMVMVFPQPERSRTLTCPVAVPPSARALTISPGPVRPGPRRSRREPPPNPNRLTLPPSPRRMLLPSRGRARALSPLRPPPPGNGGLKPWPRPRFRGTPSSPLPWAIPHFLMCPRAPCRLIPMQD